MASKNNQKKYGFSSLSIYRVADEEIGKLKNNRIHYTYQNNNNSKNNDFKNGQNILYKSEQVNQKYPQNKNKSKEKNNRNKNIIKINNRSSNKYNENADSKNKNKLNILRISNSSKDKISNKVSIRTNKSKNTKKRNNDHIDRIIIDLVSNNDDNITIKTDSNYYENEDIYKNYMNNKDNNSETNNYDIKDNNINNNQMDNLQIALDMVGERWVNDCIKSHELNILFLSNEIGKKKREIENIINKSTMEKNIVKEINLSFIKNKKYIKEREINQSLNRWNNNNIKKEKNKFFTIFKKVDKNNFLYSEKNYIEDLTKNIFLPKNNKNIFCLLNNDNFNKIDYKIIKTNDKNQLEKDLYNFYQEKKINYIKNKDNNEELKINPIYILNDKQIKQLYEELNLDNKSTNNKFDNLNTQLSVARQTAIDYEIIEVFTPKNNNIDNNSNNSLSKRSIVMSDLKNDKVSEMNYIGQKRSSEDFGQYTPISMLSEKFCVYAVSRNIKYSIPERQGFLNFINYNSKKNCFDYDFLKRNNFNLKIEKCDRIDSFKSSKNTTKRIDESIDKKNNSIIDYSKYSNNSNKSLGKNIKNK